MSIHQNQLLKDLQTENILTQLFLVRTQLSALSIIV